MKLIIDIAMSRNSCHKGQNFAMNLWENDRYYISLFEKFQLSHDKHDIIHTVYIVMGHFLCNKESCLVHCIGLPDRFVMICLQHRLGDLTG